MDAPAVIPLTPDNAPAAGDVLARAFMDDPLFRWCAPDEGRRTRFLSKCMAAFARYAAPLGESLVSSDGSGAALWLPPSEDGRVRRLPMLRAGIVGAMFSLGLDGSRRFMAAGDEIEAAHTHAMRDRDHWYLMDLGVDPARQSNGIGSALIAHGLARADASGLPCYLETQNERAVAFYERHTFAVIRDLDLPLGGPRLWTFVREPVPATPPP
jgi:ribosomal protein S18 acetylase RimI-like enzyme